MRGPFVANAGGDTDLRARLVSVDRPSERSLEVERALIGEWETILEKGQAMPGVALSALTFRLNGLADYVYEETASKTRRTQTDKYRIVHRGTTKVAPGKLPSVFLEQLAVASQEFVELSDVVVDYDNRFPVELGPLLKFKNSTGSVYVLRRKDLPKEAAAYRKTEVVEDPRGSRSSAANLGAGAAPVRVDARRMNEVLVQLASGTMSEEERNKAVLELMNARATDGAGVLRRLAVTDNSIIVRVNSVRALGVMADRESTQTLIAILDKAHSGDIDDCGGDETMLRRVCVEALGNIGGEQGIAAIRKVAAAEDEYRCVREAAQVVLSRQ